MTEPRSLVTNCLRYKSTGERIAALTCKCGATLDDRGRCPALCQPLPLPQPKYDGPAIIGLTHVGRLGRAE